MTAAAIDQAADAPTPVLWTREDLEKALSLSRTASFMLVKEADFPTPVRLYGENGHRRWYAAEVMAWVERMRKEQ